MYAVKVAGTEYYISYNHECIDCRSSGQHLLARIRKYHKDAREVPEDVRDPPER